MKNSLGTLFSTNVYSQQIQLIKMSNINEKINNCNEA